MDTDKNLTCCNCGKAFVFTEAEQQFFALKGLLNDPKRCPDCRLELRNWRKSKSGGEPAPVAVVSCDTCGATIKVPFQPKGHKPIYCLQCMHVKPAPTANTDHS
ncbi:MAG TPA: zinc-ribbon domain containing protein [Candidatus Obscuribacterales bacterium]